MSKSPTTTGAVERLTRLRDSFASTGAPTAITTLVCAAVSTADEGIAEATLTWLREHGPREGAAMAAVDRELREDARPPALFMEVSLAMPERQLSPGSSDADRWLLETANAMDVRFGFRREDDRTPAGARLGARILFPAKAANALIVEAAGRRLQKAWQSLVPNADDARAGLLADALDRAAKLTTSTK